MNRRAFNKTMVGASMIILQGMPEKKKSRYLMPGDKVA
jgi:hypothetical protein